MPWTNQNGGGRGPGGRGPWGGGQGPASPDLEELLKRSQDRLRRVLPGGGFGRSGFIAALLIALVVWLASGIYTVSNSEQGVVLRFGKFVALTTPGINYHLPWPIETALTPQVTQSQQIDIGYRRGGQMEDGNAADVPEESLMLTGDENIVDIGFTVFWIIKDAPAYEFNVEDTDGAIKAVAESAMREVVGRNEIALIQTVNREAIQEEVRKLMQTILDSYGAGVTIAEVKMQKVDPPPQVLDAYRDVQAARTDQERMRNEAQAYANKVVPEARGAAARIIQQAEGYKQQVIAEAQGEAKRFISVYEQYKKAPEVTRRRIYLETMEDVLSPMNKVIVEKGGVVPYMPLPGLQTQPTERGTQ